MTDRIKLMREQMKRKPHICIEAYKIISDTYRSMIGEPVVRMRAEAAYNIYTKIPIFIREGDLLCGNGASRENAVEIDISGGLWDKYEIDALREDGYGFDPEDEPILFKLNAEMPPFSLQDGVGEVVDDDSHLYPFQKSGLALARWKSRERGRQNMMCVATGGLGLAPAQALVCLDYETVMKTGIDVMIEKCTEEIRKISYHNYEDYDKALFLRCMRRSLEGLNIYAARYVALCEEKAAAESDPARKKELLEMADICRQVPSKPARTFREAFQCYWFIFHCVACPNAVLGMGRLDQLFYPYYVEDKKNGRITDKEVVELFELLRLKDMELGSVTSKKHRDESDAEAKWHNVIIGGTKPDGTDATNELSYLILDAMYACPTLHYTITMRVGKSTPNALVEKGLECVKLGYGMPSFISEKSYLNYFLMNGVPEEMARDYVVTGCLDGNLPGNARSMTCSMFVTPLVLDLFMHRGYDQSIDYQLGHDLGDLDQWKTFEEFEEAFKKEFAYYLGLMSERCNLVISSMQRYFPEPLKTAFMYRGIEDGVDYQCKRMPFENGGVISAVGLVNLGNSLYAIKKLVYEDKMLKLSELQKALEANWVGYEDLQRTCLELPKYGNDIDEVDQIVAEYYDFFAKTCETFKCVTGDKFRAAGVSIFSHAPGGAQTHATPDGRFDGETLADGAISPVGGQDKNGPLAMLKSGMKIPQDQYQATLLNMKFLPSALKTPQDVAKLGAVIKVYFENGGKQVQFNICDEKTLRAAQAEPENYEDLVVRVAGYSAYFTQITRRLQDEIIRRTVNESV